MAIINPKIFKKYDIRGKAEGSDAVVTEAAALLIGQAFGTALQRAGHKPLVVVGHDNRTTSPALAAAVMDGLRKSGCTVAAIGLAATPQVYWYEMNWGYSGGVVVTGSHLAPDQNGFKLRALGQNVYGDNLLHLRNLIEADDLDENPGGTIASVEGARASYTGDVQRRISMSRGLKVVIDAGNGTGGLTAPALFERWGHTVVECLYCEPDGRYPNHQPDPQDPKNMQMLGARVRELGADVGIAFDGDADRMGAVDEQGNIVVADRILALLAQDMLTRYPGMSVVADVLSSQALFDVVAQAGGKPVMWISGHSLIKAKMAEIGSLLGGEMSGHIFLGEDYFGFDDGFFAAGRLLQLLANAAEPLSALNARLPVYYSTPEYRPHCPDEAKARVIAGVKAALAGDGEVVDVDGVRIQFARGWGILRASNTEPVLSLRFEGQTETDALEYRERFLGALAQFPEVEPVQV
jgi:phosphomannomutase / phosphoglucomutase